MSKKTMLRKIKSGLSKLLPEDIKPASLEEPEPKVPIVEEETSRVLLPRRKQEISGLKKDYFEELRNIDETYPLITIKVKNQLVPLSYARIKFDKNRNQLTYNLIEPRIDVKSKRFILRTIEELHESLEVNFSQLKAESAVYQYIDRKIEDIWKEIGIKLSAKEIMNAKYYIFREIIGLGKIDAIFHDPNIEDIACDGIKLPIFVFHRNPIYGEIPTNIYFGDKDELDSFVIKLAQKCKRTVSVAEPLMDGSMPDGSRVQVTYGTDIARKGSNFTIRKFFRIPLTPIDLINFGTIDSLTLAYLWLAIEKEKSILISGTTATGKTTFLNVLAMFIDPNLKIVSIEDTAELKLIHINWMPQITRAGIGPSEYGEVSMDTLLKSALRQRPDYLIVGEVRGKEANVLFNAQASIPEYERVFAVDQTGKTSISPISNFLNSNIRVPAVTENPGVKLEPVKKTDKHFPTKTLYSIKTRTGREVITSENHSLLTLKTGEIQSIFANKLKKGIKIAIPAKLPSEYADINLLNLLELLPEIRVVGEDYVKAAVKKIGYAKAIKIHKSISNNCYERKEHGLSALRCDKFMQLMSAADIDYDINKLKVRFNINSKRFPAKLPLTNELLRLMGYFISEGSLNKINYGCALYNKDPQVLEDMRKCIVKVTGELPKERETKGFGTSTELRFNHRILFELFKQYCGENSSTRKIPKFIFGLSREKIGQFISALYTGDGGLRKKGFCYWTSSKELANDLMYLLLMFGIVARVKSRDGTNKLIYEIEFYRKNEQEEFLRYTNVLGKKEFKLGKYSMRNKNKIGDIYLDEVKKIKKMNLKESAPLYDFCVPGPQNFVGGFGGIYLHNTGHPGLSTLHADTVDAIIDRLTTRPIDLPVSLLANLDVIVFLEKVKKEGKFVRRIGEVIEIEGYDHKNKALKTHAVFKWDPKTDSFNSGDSYLLKSLAERYGWNEQEMQSEISRRESVLDWMKAKKIFHFRDVSSIINMYYRDPQKLFSMMRQR